MARILNSIYALFVCLSLWKWHWFVGTRSVSHVSTIGEKNSKIVHSAETLTTQAPF